MTRRRRGASRWSGTHHPRHGFSRTTRARRASRGYITILREVSWARMLLTPNRGIGGYLPYVLAVVMAVVLVVVTVSRGGPSDAAKDTLGGKQLKIMAPADPGGGWDSTARAMQAALEDIVGRSEVYNVTGAGGTIGLSQFVNYEGQSNQLMVMGLVMVGAIAANEPKVKLDQVTPIAELVNEEQLIVVPDEVADQGRRRPRGGHAQGHREGRLGRRVGRWRRADPGRADRQGPRAGSRPTSTTSPTPAAVRRSRRCCPARTPSGSRASRSSGRRSRQASCARSPSPAPTGSTS